MDSYLYMNRTLAKRLKELKIIEFNNMNQVKNVKRIDETKRKIETLEEKLKKIKNQYAYSLLQQERLNILTRHKTKKPSHP
jgi:predicted  nucleic acid-binding Zn-ribbon protein